MKTAVEWLQCEFNKWAEGKIFIPQDFLEEAKRLEKKQIMDAWYNGFDELRPYVDHSEEYYNKTYNQNDNL